MVTIRLARVGTKKRPIYRIVAADSRRPRGGKFLEVLGTYDPMNLQVKADSQNRKEKGIFTLKTDRVQHWLSKGARPSETVGRLIEEAKVNEKAA